MSATPDTHPTADTATRPIASHPANPVARKTIISGLSIHTQMSSVAGAPIVYLLGDVADNSPVQVPEGVSLVNVGADLWEENFSPWCAPRVFAKAPRKRSIPLSTRSSPGRSRSLPIRRHIGCLWDTRLLACSASGPAYHRLASRLSQPSSALELSPDRFGSQGFWTT